MALDEVSKSVKSFVDERLKSPYFASVIFVWIIVNKVLIFGLFNFDEKMSMSDRIVWVSDKLSEFNFNGLNGFYGSVIFSIVIGFLAMVVFNLLNGFGKTIYKLVNKLSILMLQFVDPPSWINIKEFDKTSLKLDETKNSLANKLRELSEAENLNKQLQQSIGSSEERIGQMTTELSRVQSVEESLRSENQRLKEYVDNPKKAAYELSAKLKEPEDLFVGIWVNNFERAGGIHNREEFRVTKNSMYINEVLSFTIEDFKSFQDRIEFTKVSIKNSNHKLVNRLLIVNDRWVEGWEEGTTFVRYTRYA